MPCGGYCSGAADRFASLERRPKPLARLGYRFSDEDGPEDNWSDSTFLSESDCPDWVGCGLSHRPPLLVWQPDMLTLRSGSATSHQCTCAGNTMVRRGDLPDADIIHQAASRTYPCT